VYIASVGRAFPAHYYSQGELLDALKGAWRGQMFNLDRLERLHQNVLVGGRYLALPLEEYSRLETWGDANDAWIDVALDVGEAAIRDAAEAAGIELNEIDALFFATVTGVATPSLDARLMNRLGLRSDVKRIPIFGLGCVAGAAGIARAADYVRAYPKSVAVLLSVELCSLTLQREDFSVANLVSSGLFGDGAAAVVVCGADFETPDNRGDAAVRPPANAVRADDRRGPQIVATRSVFYPDSEDVMGWSISERGFQVVLSADVPEVVRRFLARDVDAFLAEHGLSRQDVEHWIAHPGGPRVLEAIQESLEISPEALSRTWTSLREVGNISSTSVLLILRDTLNGSEPSEGAPGWGLLFALGPGFCCELVLLRWPSVGNGPAEER